MQKDINHKTMISPGLAALILLFAGTLALFLLLEVRAAGRKPVSRYISMREEAAAKAYIWLNRIEDMPLSYEEIKEIMGFLQLEILLTPTGEKNVYSQSLADGTVEACRKQAQSGLEKAYRETLKARILASGYEGGISDELLDSLMQEAYGISVSEYLDYCGVELLPSEEELAERYSGEAAYE